MTFFLYLVSTMSETLITRSEAIYMASKLHLAGVKPQPSSVAWNTPEAQKIGTDYIMYPHWL